MVQLNILVTLVTAVSRVKNMKISLFSILKIDKFQLQIFFISDVQDFYSIDKEGNWKLFSPDPLFHSYKDLIMLYLVRNDFI